MKSLFNEYSIVSVASIHLNNLIAAFGHRVYGGCYVWLRDAGPYWLNNATRLSNSGVCLDELVSFAFDLIPKILNGIHIRRSCLPVHDFNVLLL